MLAPYPRELFSSGVFPTELSSCLPLLSGDIISRKTNARDICDQARFSEDRVGKTSEIKLRWRQKRYEKGLDGSILENNHRC